MTDDEKRVWLKSLQENPELFMDFIKKQGDIDIDNEIDKRLYNFRVDVSPGPVRRGANESD